MFLVVKRLHICYTIFENVLVNIENVIDWRPIECFYTIELLSIAS